MKISQQQLRNIILQEVSRVLGEGPEEEHMSIEQLNRHLIEKINNAQKEEQKYITLDRNIANQIRHFLSAETYSQELQKRASEEARNKKNRNRGTPGD